MKNKIAKFHKVSFNEYSKVCHLDNLLEIHNKIKLPFRMTKGSAGYDFFAPFKIELNPGQTIIIPTGIKCEIDNNYFLMLCAKSGLGFKYRLQLDNTIGIIDSDYFYTENEGHIFAKLTNCSLDNKKIIINPGEAFIQGIFIKYGLTYDDNTTENREGGLGSTTINKENKFEIK